jgi:transcription factor SPN1
LKSIFGDSDDEKLGEFSSDEENFSDLSDIDEGVVPRAKKNIKALVTYHRRLIAASKKKGKPSGRRGGGYDSDDGEVNMGDILPDGTKRRRRPVDDDLDDPTNAAEGGAAKRGNGKKMSEEEITARCVAFVEKMEQACHEDNESNRQKKPALKKMALLEEAKQMMLREEWHENLLNAGILVVCTKWLSPLPDRTLPGISIRDGILRSLASFNDITKYMLKESKIGSIVMFLSKNDPEPSLRKTAADLVQQWSRTLSSGSDSWQNLAEVERHRAATVGDTRLSENAKRILSTQMAYGRKIQGSEPAAKKVRGPQFASQPLVSTMDYLIRPESKIDVTTLVKKSASVRVFAKGTR